MFVFVFLEKETGFYIHDSAKSALQTHVHFIYFFTQVVGASQLKSIGQNHAAAAPNWHLHFFKKFSATVEH